MKREVGVGGERLVARCKNVSPVQLLKFSCKNDHGLCKIREVALSKG